MNASYSLILQCVARGTMNLMTTTGTYVPMSKDDWDKVEHDTARALCCCIKDVRAVTQQFKS